jgi:hypothetical protein
VAGRHEVPPLCWTGSSTPPITAPYGVHDRLSTLSRHAPHTAASTGCTRPSSIWTAFPRTRNPRDFVFMNGDATMASRSTRDYIAGFDEGVLAGP